MGGEVFVPADDDENDSDAPCQTEDGVDDIGDKYLAEPRGILPVLQVVYIVADEEAVIVHQRELITCGVREREGQCAGTDEGEYCST